VDIMSCWLSLKESEEKEKERQKKLH